MKQMMLGLLIATFMTVVSAQAKGADDVAAREVRRAIEQRSRVFEQCYAKHDAACLINGYYVPDAEAPVVSPPGGQPPVRGSAGITAMFEKEFAGVQAIRLETIDVIAEGRMAYEIGRAHLTLRSGESAVARYAVLWVKGADGWRAKVDFIAADGW